MTNEELIKKLEEYDIEVNKLFQENKKLKSRINKAIEYIRSQYTITDDDLYLALYSSDGTLDKLEKKLKGEENEI